MLDGVIQGARSSQPASRAVVVRKLEERPVELSARLGEEGFRALPARPMMGQTPWPVSEGPQITGVDIELLSPFSDANRDADARAFAALMRHIKAVDGQQHTVIMIQVENEVGMQGGHPRPLAGGRQGLRGAGAEGADGLPSAAQGHPDSGVSQGVGGGRLQDIRDLGRGVRQERGDG